MKRKHILLSAVLFPAVMAFAQQYGGMWIPTELNEKHGNEDFGETDFRPFKTEY